MSRTSILEALILTAGRPLSVADLREAVADGATDADILKSLLELQAGYADRGVRLMRVASGWTMRTAPMAPHEVTTIGAPQMPRLTRAALELLAIIAYRQPVTRGDMEAIRGVSPAMSSLQQLEDRGWIDVIGHRQTAGQPALYATTDKLLDDLGRLTLSDLPSLSPPQTEDQIKRQLHGACAQMEVPSDGLSAGGRGDEPKPLGTNS